MATPTMVTVIGDLAPNLTATKVLFRIPTRLAYSNGPDVILSHTIEVDVAPDGTFEVDVYGTNDPLWSPVNWNYKVTIVGDNILDTYYAQVPYDAVSINFSAILPALTPSQGSLYAAFSHGSHVLVLGPGDPVPPGTPDNTVVFRTA